MKKTSVISTLLLIALIALVAYELSQLPLFDELNQAQYLRTLYTTNTARLPMVGTYCGTVTTLNITNSDKRTNDMYMSTLGTYLKANSTVLVTDLVNLNFTDFFKEIQVNGIGTLVFIGAFVLGLIILIISGPFFLCCCCCQEDCPARCCRDKDPRFTAFELNWVTTFLVVILLLIIATSIPAMTNSKSFFAKFNCQASKFIDDFYNGNVTQDRNYFFSGVTQIRSQLTTILSPNLAAIQTQIGKIKGDPGTPIDNALTNTVAALNGMKNVPNGVDSNLLTFSYNYPLDDSTPTDTLTSEIGTKIGVYTDNTKLLGKLYNLINTLQTNLTNIKTAASNVYPQLTSGNMGSQITATDTILSQVEDNLNSLKQSINSFISLLVKVDSYNIQYSLALYGVALAVSIFLIIGIVFIKCFSMIGCRFFIYSVCFITFLLCIIMFIVTIILSILAPTLFYTCGYMQDSFKSPTAVQNMMNTLGGTTFTTVSSYFKQCFNGNNDFMLGVNPTLRGNLDNLQKAVSSAKLYDFTGLNNNITNQLSTMKNTIDDCGYGRVPDYDVTSLLGKEQINRFNKISNHSLFTTSCPSSSFTSFYTDIWVPSISAASQTYVSCDPKVGIDSTVCTSGLITGCPYSRCLDTFSLMDWYNRGGTTGNIITDANSRYGTCNNFNNYLTNFLTNYVVPVSTKIGNSVQDSADSTKLAGRFNSMKLLVETVNTQMSTNVQPLFTQTYGNLSSTLSAESIFDPTKGLLVGLDCRLLSQDIQNVVDSFCISTFNLIHFALITTGIMAFGLQFAVCCGLCFTVRHTRQMKAGNRQRKGIIPINDTSSLKDF